MRKHENRYFLFVDNEWSEEFVVETLTRTEAKWMAHEYSCHPTFIKEINKEEAKGFIILYKKEVPVFFETLLTRED